MNINHQYILEESTMAMTRVSPPQLIDAGTRLNETAGQYNAAVEAFYNKGAELDTMWDGEASQKFFVALGNDREQINKLTKNLQQYAQLLIDIGNEYIRRENEATEAVGRGKK